MRLVGFQVQMYRCVMDSTWIPVTPLTVLVGKNESGKTAILKALHKLNPFHPEPYHLREWPRGHRGARSPDQVVCTAELELSATEEADLLNLLGASGPLKRLKVTRDYRGTLAVVFPTSVLAASVPQSAHDYVVSHLPTFVYLDEYGIFRGHAILNQVQQRRDEGTLTDEDRTFLTILDEAGLDLDRETQAAAATSKEDRQYDLSDAAATLTRKLADHWTSRRYELDFRVDGFEFFTFVKSDRDRALTRLEERSRGFQWFFSFDLMLMHETRGRLKECVILLDEPGLHLHPQAQRDLLDRLAGYAETNTLIYTTHLPFMVDLTRPEGIRVIGESDAGSVVSEDLGKSEPEAKAVLQAALGIQGRLGHPVAERNLVVEGADDAWFLTALSNLMIRSGLAGLPADLMISAAGTPSEVTALAAFLAGQSSQVVALYDSDPAGNAAKDELINDWLVRYRGGKAGALSVGPAMKVMGRDVSVEDLFPEDFYLKHVLEVYKQPLAGAGTTAVTLPAGNQLMKRVEAFFHGVGVPFNRGAVARRICEEINRMRSTDHLPTSSKPKVEALIAAINKALE
ncbi:MAG TPA: AAA family ATPase [Methylomirabilota bacterium]